MDLETVDKLLTTTRAVRKRLDFSRPVPPQVIEACLQIAIQAPTGSNSQGWHFLVVNDPDLIRQVGSLYKDSFYEYAKSPVKTKGGHTEQEFQESQMKRVVSSALYLANQMEKVPVLVLACIEGRVEKMGAMAQAGLYGSILPAVWSFMLALRARGLGSVWTTLHLRYEQEVAAILGIPEQYTQAAMIPVAYYLGDDFRPATRIPVSELTSWNQWGNKRD